MSAIVWSDQTLGKKKLQWAMGITWYLIKIFMLSLDGFMNGDLVFKELSKMTVLKVQVSPIYWTLNSIHWSESDIKKSIYYSRSSLHVFTRCLKYHVMQTQAEVQYENAMLIAGTMLCYLRSIYIYICDKYLVKTTIYQIWKAWIKQ